VLAVEVEGDQCVLATHLLLVGKGGQVDVHMPHHLDLLDLLGARLVVEWGTPDHAVQLGHEVAPSAAFEHGEPRVVERLHLLVGRFLLEADFEAGLSLLEEGGVVLRALLREHLHALQLHAVDDLEALFDQPAVDEHLDGFLGADALPLLAGNEAGAVAGQKLVGLASGEARDSLPAEELA